MDEQHGATVYTIQLGLNLLFQPLYFGLKRPVEAAINVLAVSGLVGYLIHVWAQIDSVAAWCLAPYLAWLSFASYLAVRLLSSDSISLRNERPVCPGWLIRSCLFADRKRTHEWLGLQSSVAGD